MASASDFLPVANYTKPFWLSEEDYIGTFRSTEELPKESEIVIIGSGYAGTSTSWYLMKENPDLKVTVLEARNICSGATGRNGGHLKPFYFGQHNQILKEYGLEEAAKNAEYEYRHLGEIKRLTEEEGIDCDLSLTRFCDFFYDSEKAAKLQAELKDFYNNPYVSQTLKDLYQVTKGDNLKVISQNDKTELAFTAPAASIWPWKFITGLLKKLIKNPSFNLQANTPVTEVKKLDSGKYSVITPRGEIIADKVVYATNGYTKAILPQFKEIILPFKGTVTHILPKDKAKIPYLGFSSVIYTNEYDADYLINRPDGSIVIGGGIHTFLKGRPDFKSMLDTVDDSTNLKETEEYLKDYAAKTYSSWKGYDAENDYYWSGIMGYSNDELPYVGSLKDLGLDNSFIIAGFSGHGMPRVLLSGKALLKSILSGEPLDDIPECFKFSTKRMEKPHMTVSDIAERVEFHNLKI